MHKKSLLILLIIACCHSVTFGQFRKRNAPKVQALDEQNLNYTNPAEYFISGIKIKGLKVLDENAMISLTGLKIGDKIRVPGDQISNAIRKLWRHGLVGNASIFIDKIENQNIFLSIVLTELPRLVDFYFTGIGQGQQSSLKEELSLIRGKIVNNATIKNTELMVKKFFIKKGFLNTTVKISQEQDTLNRGGIRIRIDVDKHSKVRINKIIFKGNHQFSSAKLKGQLKQTKEYARILLFRKLIGLFKNRRVSSSDSTEVRGWARTKEFILDNVKLNIFSGSKLIQSSFEEDKEKLIAYYNERGYRDATIVRDTITRYDENTVDVHIEIVEGKKYYFRDITWVGNYVHSTSILEKVLGIQRGDIYNKELINRQTTYNPKGADVSSLYMDDGYLFFRVMPTEVAIDGDSIDIEMRIFEGEQATVRNVTITGNTRTNDHVIRRELSTIPGQKFRRSDIIRTQQQLSQMGFFDPQKIEPQIMPNPANGTVDIEWKLEEQSNDQVQLSGGWGGAFGFVGTAGITFNNFSVRNIPHFDKWRPLPIGDGQRLSLSIQSNGASYQNYKCSFTEPWLGGRKPNSFTISLNHSISRRTTRTFQADNSVSLQQSGLTIGIGRRLIWPDNYFTLLNSLSFLVYNYKGDYFRSAVVPDEGQTTSIKFITTLSRNSIDHPIYPTHGSIISLSLALTPPYSVFNPNYFEADGQELRQVEMHKWMFDSKFYLKLAGSKKPDGRSLVLETKVNFGFIGRYSESLPQGPFERFLLGGDGLAGGFNSFVLGQDVIGLRGYANNSITPPLYSLQNTIQSDGVQGGIVYNKISAEIRYPVTISQVATIYGLLFVEGGNNWDNFKEFNPFQIYKSAGVGLRIFMPAFGLIGLNWAYGFDTLPGSLENSGSQFHFTIGQQIR